MFTIKYRQFARAAEQPADGPTLYDMSEQITGPYTMISHEHEQGGPVVYAHNGDAPGTQFGPNTPSAPDHPRATLWVMNENGSTVAKYDL